MLIGFLLRNRGINSDLFPFHNNQGYVYYPRVKLDSNARHPGRVIRSCGSKPSLLGMRGNKKTPDHIGGLCKVQILVSYFSQVSWFHVEHAI